MKNKSDTNRFGNSTFSGPLMDTNAHPYPGNAGMLRTAYQTAGRLTGKPEILIISSFPPRECGIATYSQDLIKALRNKFGNSLSFKVCALESGSQDYSYTEDVKYKLNTNNGREFPQLAVRINEDAQINMVVIQHEFGFFKAEESRFIQFVNQLTKIVVIAFHTVLPHPDKRLLANVQQIAAGCQSIIVMTKNSARLLAEDYAIPVEKITVIAHGTHLVPHVSRKFLKNKYGLKGRKVLTTFGLLSSGKSLETTLEALPAIILKNPEVIFLIIGKTHPEVVKTEGEKYRNYLMAKVVSEKLSDHVKFINSYLALPDLLEYLQLSDIYLFTTNDPNQAVSGTFAYAMSCGCPIISTPIPHARELINGDTGIIFDFRNSGQLADGVIRLLGNEPLRRSIGTNTLQKIVSTAWENSAVAHAKLFQKLGGEKMDITFDLPPINLDHLAKMTTNIGMIQFSKINQPDIRSGYTLDDNARALVATGMYYSLTQDEEILYDMQEYLDFIRYCQQPGGDFLNFVDKTSRFTTQNNSDNLDDANGRAIWALGYLISLKGRLPGDMVTIAESLLRKSLPHIRDVHSSRAMAFAIKGLYHCHQTLPSPEIADLITTFANRLIQMFKHEAVERWEWFEGYLTYANSILPEAILYAWLLTGNEEYKNTARRSLDFLLSQIFNENGIEVISNKKWLQRGEQAGHSGEQPIDVAYTVMTLSKFHEAFGDREYHDKMVIAFNWFLGQNRLHQIIYNPCTGGCYDGLEDTHVNLNQGAESTVSYLMARLVMEQGKV
jgi:glycosyltransferase involved in cell wall biosynthesis